MIRTVEEGLEKYEAELKSYKEWTDKLREYFDRTCGEGNWSPMMHFSGSEYEKLIKWNAELKAMAKVLGLSRKEEKTIDKECGIIVPTKRKAA